MAAARFCRRIAEVRIQSYYYQDAMKTIEEELPVAKFLQIHKSYIISLEHITAIRKNSVFIDEMELPVGENFREAVLNLTSRQD